VAGAVDSAAKVTSRRALYDPNYLSGSDAYTRVRYDVGNPPFSQWINASNTRMVEEKCFQGWH